MNEQEKRVDFEAVFREMENPAQHLKDNTGKLNKFGGFAIIDTSLEGVKNMDPEKKARKNIFLTEEQFKGEKEQLKQRMKLWYELLSSNEKVDEMLSECNAAAQEASNLLKQNLTHALEETKELETAYRGMSLFYQNAESEKVKNMSIINADMEQLRDLDDSMGFIRAITEELNQNYDRLDLRNNYSVMAIPGYLGQNSILDTYARIAHDNKVVMLTDFRDLESAESTLDMFTMANHAGGDSYRSHVMMGCNYLVARPKEEGLEDEPLYVPPSFALAGRMYAVDKVPISQVIAGKKYGCVNGIDGVRFEMKKSELSALEREGLVPMVSEYGKVMAFSAKTLFNGDNLGMQTGSVVRVFDWITKVLVDFLNRRAFENFDNDSKQDMRSQIVKFLDSITGPGKIIEKFKILQFERDPKQRDRIFLDIHIVPYFPAKSFMMKLDGMKGDDPDSPEWKTDVSQTS